MKALVFGSLNIDKVYSLDHLPEKGETLRCTGYELHVGGKGLNQALALKKAGLDVSMAGAVGEDGAFLKDYLDENGVDASLLLQTDGFSGHAVIEIDPDGQNQMVLFAGANYKVTPEYCDKALEGFKSGDLLLMQYETSCVEYMAKKAHEKGLAVALNPSPFVNGLLGFPYEYVDLLVLNESEGKSLTEETQAEKIAEKLLARLNGGSVALTLGSDGAVFADKSGLCRVPAFKVGAVDTTGAGDTFTGYFLKAYLGGANAKTALTEACAAAAIAVTKRGAAETIPAPSDVERFLAGIEPRSM